MKDEFLIVDGYNIIYAWDHLKEIAMNDSLENARWALLEEMSNYQGYYDIKVIVIFDSHKTKEKMRKITNYKNLELVFTKENETADHFIERVTHMMGRQERIRVATSDGLEQLIVLSSGATRMSARELLIEVKRMKKKIHNDIKKKQEGSKNLLEKHLSEETIQWMEKMRRQ